MMFNRLVKTYLKAGLARPFNKRARAAAGMGEEWYLPVEMDALRAQLRDDSHSNLEAGQV